MPTLFGRQYARPSAAVGVRERALGGLILLLTAGLGVAFVVHVRSVPAASPEPASDNPFPALGLAGWRRPMRAEHFTPQNLHEKINGRAEAFLQAGCRGLLFGRYTSAGPPGRSVDVYSYDLGQPAAAQAVYTAEKPPAVPVLRLGDEAYTVGGALFFCIGAQYVQVLPAGTDEDEARAAQEIARRLAQAWR